MMDTVELGSKDLVKDKIDKLKQIFPDTVKDGKIDFDTLKLVLGEEIEKDKESYKFEWVGKTNCYKTVQTPSLGTLKPQKEESIDFDNSENIIIEGDNLEVLKLLQTNYANKIKMIYIDPPYNTGNDFVYPDNFNTPLDNYFELTGQKENGETTQSKKSKEGRKHTQWLNMIFPRLILSRTLLTEDGVIFISIDDNEVDNMRKVCNDIFGDENFIEQIIWKKRASPPNDKIIASTHEYILIYGKNINLIKLYRQPRNKEQLSRYKNIDNHPKGKWIPDNLMANVKGGRFSKSLYYPIINPFTKEEHYPSSNGNWRYSKETINKLLEENSIYFGINGKGRPKLKRFLCDVQDGVPFSTNWDNVGYNNSATGELSKIFGSISYFETPKPITLIKNILKLSTKKDDIVLDFFAGSGTTGHSVLELNQEDKGNRKFILVQLPEKTNNPDYPTICDITKERIRRVIKGYGDNPQPINDGFKVFKLDKSNYIINEKISVNPQSNKEDIIQQLRNSLLNDNHLVEGYKNIDIVYEVILKEGYSLNSKIEEIKILDTNIYKVVDNSKRCYITLDNVDTDILKDKEFLGISKDTLFVCLDKDLTDSDKSNLSLTFQLKTI